MHLTYLLTCCFNFRFLLNILVNSRRFYLNMCCELKQRFMRVWHGVDQTIIDNAIDEWSGRLRACRLRGQKPDTSSNYCDNIQPYDKRLLFFSNLTRFLDFFWKLPQFHTSNFRKVVQQHTESMVGSIMWVLLEIYLAFQQWKKFENPLRTDKVIAMSLMYYFFGTVHNRANFTIFSKQKSCKAM